MLVLVACFIVTILCYVHVSTVASKDIKELLEKDECKQIHSKTTTIRRRYFTNKNMQTEVVLSSTIPYVFEDLYLGRRFESMHPSKQSVEVTVNHKYKFVYINIRKSASSAIASFLESHFSTKQFSGCTTDPVTENSSCILYLGRCTATCISDDMLSNYFFFSFARNPWDRFFSSMKQTNAAPTNRRALRQLRHMNSTHRVGNEHYETQSLSLFSPTHDGRGVLPLHYLGQTETLSRDMTHILRLIANRSDTPLPPSLLFTARHHRTDTVTDQELGLVDITNETPAMLKSRYDGLKMNASLAVRRLVNLVYAQDFMCLGYPFVR